MPVTINWARCHTRPVLMIPGPTELPPPVIQALNQPPTIQYDDSFDVQVLEPTTLALREVFQTRHEVILMPGSGRTALEAGALSVIEPGDRVIVVVAGVFGALTASRAILWVQALPGLVALLLVLFRPGSLLGT